MDDINHEKVIFINNFRVCKLLINMKLNKKEERQCLNIIHTFYLKEILLSSLIM
jgi:hypothetical protein